MYGDVLSYPVEDAGLAMRGELGRRGTLCAPRAPLAARLVGRFHPIWDFPECHSRDIGWRVHKLISWNGLDLELQPKVTHFCEKRVILCHFETSF